MLLDIIIAADVSSSNLHLTPARVLLVAEVGAVVGRDRADHGPKPVTVAPYAHTPQTKDVTPSTWRQLAHISPEPGHKPKG